MLRQATSLFYIGLLIITASLTSGCDSTSKVAVKGGTGTEPVELLRQTNGSNDAFAKIGGYLINSADDSAADLSSLSPNYDTESVIVVSLGEVPTGGFGVTITGVQKQGDKVFVQFTTSQPAADAVVTQAISHPYAAVAVPKVTGTLFLEESN